MWFTENLNVQSTPSQQRCVASVRDTLALVSVRNGTASQENKRRVRMTINNLQVCAVGGELILVCTEPVNRIQTDISPWRGSNEVFLARPGPEPFADCAFLSSPKAMNVECLSAPVGG